MAEAIVTDKNAQAILWQQFSAARAVRARTQATRTTTATGGCRHLLLTHIAVVHTARRKHLLSYSMVVIVRTVF
jgi:hypothetical protein